MLNAVDNCRLLYVDPRYATTNVAERPAASNARPLPGSRIEVSLVVICLCAEWCDTCNDFRAAFTRLLQQERSHRFLWLDIEEHERLLEDIDIQDFPTIVIADDHGKVCFSGPIIPHLETLQRLCVAAQAGELRSTDAVIWENLVRRVQTVPGDG